MAIPVRVLNLGRLGYLEALQVQQKCVNNILSSFKNVSSSSRIDSSSPKIDSSSPKIDSKPSPNTLIIVEHPPVYTIGIRSGEYSDMEEKRLKDLGAEFIRTNRGGLITFHGFGQLVAYPILNLADFDPESKSVRKYVHKLEDTLIKTVTSIINENSSESIKNGSKLKVSTIEEFPGVWINDERKIAAIGIRESSKVTSHGLALNCNTDLSWYDHIVPCGIKNKGVTSISKELNQNFTIGQTLPYFFESFREMFKCDLIPGSLEDLDTIQEPENEPNSSNKSVKKCN